jgi:hypothetical protein
LTPHIELAAHAAHGYNWFLGPAADCHHSRADAAAPAHDCDTEFWTKNGLLADCMDMVQKSSRRGGSVGGLGMNDGDYNHDFHKPQNTFEDGE